MKTLKNKLTQNDLNGLIMAAIRHDMESAIRLQIGVPGTITVLPILLCAIFMGERIAELLRLGWSDVDLDNKVARIYNEMSNTTRVVSFAGCPLVGQVLQFLHGVRDCDAEIDSIFTFEDSNPNQILKTLKSGYFAPNHVTWKDLSHTKNDYRKANASSVVHEMGTSNCASIALAVVEACGDILRGKSRTYRFHLPGEEEYLKDHLYNFTNEIPGIPYGEYLTIKCPACGKNGILKPALYRPESASFQTMSSVLHSGKWVEFPPFGGDWSPGECCDIDPIDDPVLE